MNEDHFLPRPDAESAIRVNNAITIQATGGTFAAAQYLQRRGIAFPVALRVLTRPHRRRRH